MLKEAGVVDSGGKDCSSSWKGCCDTSRRTSRWTPPTAIVSPSRDDGPGKTPHRIEPGRITKWWSISAPTSPLDLENFYGDLATWAPPSRSARATGCTACTSTSPPRTCYTPIDYTRRLGTITKVAIENLVAQMEAISKAARKAQSAAIEPGQIAVVAVSPDRVSRGSSPAWARPRIVEGGQTMNPSTKDILRIREPAHR